MKLPENKVLTRTDWKKKRDNKGGKSGLSKIEVGPGLNDFHEAYKKAEKSGDVEPLNKEITSLIKKMKTYISDVKEKYKDVAALATKEILNELQSMETAIENAAKEKADAPEKMIEQLTLVIAKHRKQLDPYFNLIERAKKTLENVHVVSSSPTLDPNMIPNIRLKVETWTTKTLEQELPLKKSWAAMGKDILLWEHLYMEKTGASKSEAFEKRKNHKDFVKLLEDHETCLDNIHWVRGASLQIAGGAKTLEVKPRAK